MNICVSAQFAMFYLLSNPIKLKWWKTKLESDVLKEAVNSQERNQS